MIFSRLVEKPILCPACCGLSLGLLALMAGCTPNPHSVEHVEVSGKVLFKGEPLPGGRVTFVAVKGGFASSGNIDQNGHYQVKAPIGDVEIGVDNRMLQPRRGPKAPPHPKQPGAEEEGQAVKGQWKNIPSSYADPHASGLKYTVKPGPQTHDIDLPATPPATTGAPSQ